MAHHISGRQYPQAGTLTIRTAETSSPRGVIVLWLAAVLAATLQSIPAADPYAVTVAPMPAFAPQAP